MANGLVQLLRLLKNSHIPLMERQENGDSEDENRKHTAPAGAGNRMSPEKQGLDFPG
jgi:hypothetical protein